MKAVTVCPDGSVGLGIEVTNGFIELGSERSASCLSNFQAKVKVFSTLPKDSGMIFDASAIKVDSEWIVQEDIGDGEDEADNGYLLVKLTAEPLPVVSCDENEKPSFLIPNLSFSNPVTDLGFGYTEGEGGGVFCDKLVIVPMGTVITCYYRVDDGTDRLAHSYQLFEATPYSAVNEPEWQKIKRKVLSRLGSKKIGLIHDKPLNVFTLNHRASIGKLRSCFGRMTRGLVHSIPGEEPDSLLFVIPDGSFSSGVCSRVYLANGDSGVPLLVETDDEPDDNLVLVVVRESIYSQGVTSAVMEGFKIDWENNIKACPEIKAMSAVSCEGEVGGIGVGEIYSLVLAPLWWLQKISENFDRRRHCIQEVSAEGVVVSGKDEVIESDRLSCGRCGNSMGDKHFECPSCFGEFCPVCFDVCDENNPDGNIVLCPHCARSLRLPNSRQHFVLAMFDSSDLDVYIH
ncbi:MAG: hypothetical protein WC797_01975 [Candidatus Paceibacterota bacterium]|jgi:hypothetical protein